MAGYAWSSWLHNLGRSSVFPRSPDGTNSSAITPSPQRAFFDRRRRCSGVKSRGCSVASFWPAGWYVDYIAGSVHVFASKRFFQLEFIIRHLALATPPWFVAIFSSLIPTSFSLISTSLLALIPASLLGGRIPLAFAPIAVFDFRIRAIVHIGFELAS